MTAAGRVVLGVDLKEFQAGMGDTDDTCSYPANDLEDISRQVQKDLPFDQYRPPVLVGIGAGAGMAYAAVTQAMPTTFAAGIGLGFCPVYLAPRPFCPDTPSTQSTSTRAGANEGRYTFGPAEKLETPWLAAPGPDCPKSDLDAVMAKTPGAQLLDAPPEQWADTVTDALSRIAAEQARSSAPADVPVVEIPAEPGQGTQWGRGDTLAIFYSGDGGWRDIDREIGQQLARSGIPVVGVDSLRYFWRERRPEEIARDLDRLIAHYTTRWARPKVLLIGYSFGADILPFTVNRISAASRGHVRLVSLLGFARQADFEVHLASFLGAGSDDAKPTLPEVTRLPPIPLQCVYGVEEEDTGCNEPELAHADKIRMDGGHHFDGDYETVANAILRAAGIDRRG